MSLVQGFVENFDFRKCARGLKNSATHTERMDVMTLYLGNVRLRHIQILRILEATVCPHWSGAWADSFTGAGAILCLPGLDGVAFHEAVMVGVEEVAPTWLLAMLDKLPLRLDTVQTSQHVRCETRKLTGPKLDRYDGYHRLRLENNYLWEFQTTSCLLRRGNVHISNLKHRLYHIHKDRTSIKRHMTQYQGFAGRGKEDKILKRYQTAVAQANNLVENLVHVGSWLLAIEDYRSTDHAHIICLLIDGLKSLARDYAAHEAQTSAKKRGRLRATMELLLERGNECECKHHKSLWSVLLKHDVRAA